MDYSKLPHPRLARANRDSVARLFHTPPPRLEDGPPGPVIEGAEWVYFDLVEIAYPGGGIEPRWKRRDGGELVPLEATPYRR